ncbi:MAG: nucleoside-diphosphate kinase [Terrimicrobiaceae bacterium]|nr:nucleoside-diphosphate kinase [Terrimicrobiaceae bacterium]
MADELSYVLITPYSLRKSRTGGIIGRLLARTGLELVGGRLFSPSPELTGAYSEMVAGEPDPRHSGTQKLIRDYVRGKFQPDADGRAARFLLLVLRGEDAVAKTRTVTGHIVNPSPRGETIRDTFGDYVVEDGRVVYFEPAVLTAWDSQAARQHLALFGRYSDSDGGIREDSVTFPAGENVETTLVLIKPDNFRFPNMRPGGVIDTFSRTGLALVGFKVHHMSVAEAEQFYGPVLDVLMDKLGEPSGKRARLVVEEELGVPLTSEVEARLAEMLGPIAGRAHWETIIQFMSGTRPSQCPPERRDHPGTEKCVALVYRGIDAVARIRAVLGPTDPSKAPAGSIRKEFGQTVMINAAHASDSAENARREMAILRLQENNLKPLLEAHGVHE